MLDNNYPQPRNAWQIMCDSVHALLLREVKTRFGTNRMGYFWALFDPIAQVAVLASIFTFIGRESVTGVPISLFLIVAILPYKLFAKLLPQLSAAVASNKALFGYRQVCPVDPVITRLLIEVVTFIVVYFIVMAIAGWLGLDALPNDLLMLLLVTFLLICFSAGLGLLLCCATLHWQDTPKLLSLILAPMFFISGVFFSATMIPPNMWFLFDWNPIFHFIELSRDAYFLSYQSPIGDIYYVAFLSLISLGVGMAMFQANRQKFITL
ncbi:ABC transporter permease [Thalassotalea sp. HSM 43]|uniref:ABC transporter permease n=1 Tax=Thalassotalea sp. HSM 43 TaxID=2552945 RepID=UPI00107FDE6B|nr:ABC transporter permease [Thalassotalea sp. HSM 43]QBY03547.1 ABC transporter permease [Thalassotalea sp. HSM 43]